MRSPVSPNPPPEAPESAYQRALRRLLALPDYERGSGPPDPGAVPFNLERPRALLRALGDPQLDISTMLIAGSKGKGSTAALAESILRAHGFRTALYTQPHLQDYRERVRIQGQLIEPDEFAHCAELVVAAAERLRSERPELGPTTTYEQTTAIAFLAALRQSEISVFEVGLGGRLDATNLCEPLVSVLAAVGLEHTRILGDTIEAITREKSAIFRPLRHAVVSRQRREALETARQVARERRAFFVPAPNAESKLVQATPLVLSTSEPRPDSQPMWRVTVQGRRYRYDNLALPLGGRIQVNNLCLALYALESLPVALQRLDRNLVREGVASTRWPGRFELVPGHAPTIVLDGAHTADSATELVRALRLHVRWSRLTLVFACLDDKDALSMLRAFDRVADRLIVTTTQHPRALAIDSILALARANEIEVSPAASTEEALRTALSLSRPVDAICVAGSLSIVGEARSFFQLPAG